MKLAAIYAEKTFFNPFTNFPNCEDVKRGMCMSLEKNEDGEMVRVLKEKWDLEHIAHYNFLFSKKLPRKLKKKRNKMFSQLKHESK